MHRSLRSYIKIILYVLVYLSNLRQILCLRLAHKYTAHGIRPALLAAKIETVTTHKSKANTRWQTPAAPPLWPMTMSKAAAMAPHNSPDMRAVARAEPVRSCAHQCISAPGLLYACHPAALSGVPSESTAGLPYLGERGIPYGIIWNSFCYKKKTLHLPYLFRWNLTYDVAYKKTLFIHQKVLLKLLSMVLGLSDFIAN